MSNPVPLLREGASDFERELLGSWQHEQPSARARQRALAIAGSGVALAVTTSASAKLASSVAPKLGLSMVIAKWLGAGVVVGLATSGATIGLVEATNRPEIKPPSAQAPIAAAPIPIAPVGMKDLPPATAELPPVIVKSPAEPKAKAAQLPTPAPNLSSGALGPETIALDQARDALRSGNASRSLELVAKYQRDFPNGVLAQEAEVLRIDALEQQGNRNEAKKTAQRFLTLHPTSAHAERLRSLSGDAKNP